MRATTCACGCGEDLPLRPYPTRFIAGHFQRTAEHKAVRRATQLTPEPGETPSGFCQCGCGGATAIARQGDRKRGLFAGYPLRYLVGHNPRGLKGAHANRWQGGRILLSVGYWAVYAPHHPHARRGGYVLEHRLVWEKAHGRQLEPDEHVHHVDGNRLNNEPANLVVMSRLEHLALHHKSPQTRQRNSLGQKRRYITNPEQRQRQADGARRSWAARKAQHAQNVAGTMPSTTV